jgi:hypothetical protein
MFDNFSTHMTYLIVAKACDSVYVNRLFLFSRKIFKNDLWNMSSN